MIGTTLPVPAERRAALAEIEIVTPSQIARAYGVPISAVHVGLRGAATYGLHRDSSERLYHVSDVLPTRRRPVEGFSGLAAAAQPPSPAPINIATRHGRRAHEGRL